MRRRLTSPAGRMCHRSCPADLDGQARYQETRAACVDYCGEQSFEVRLLDHGIATSHGQMPQVLYGGS